MCTSAKSLQLCPTLCKPMDCSPPGLPCPWTSPGKNTGVSRPPGDPPDPGIKSMSVMSPVLVGEFSTTGATWEALCICK